MTRLEQLKGKSRNVAAMLRCLCWNYNLTNWKFQMMLIQHSVKI